MPLRESDTIEFKESVTDVIKDAIRQVMAPILNPCAH